MIKQSIALCMLTLTLVASAASAKTWPAAIQAVADKGIKIVQEFEAPGELRGYAARIGRRLVALYLLPDGEHVVVGTLLDSEGNALTSKVLARINRQSITAQGPIWPRLEDSYWVADGSPNADEVVYVFTDPNCPYCHKLWQRTRAWVKAGKVQLRHIIVGFLTPTSDGKAAAILAADNSSAALRRNELHYDEGGIDPMESIPHKLRQKIHANQKLMSNLKLYGTPSIVYRDENGKIHMIQGLPRGPKLKEAMGIE